MDAKILTTFSYHKTPDGEFYPIVPITIVLKDQKLEILALVDSGANISIFRPEIAKELGINIREGKRITLKGIGGKIIGYIHNLTLETAGKIFKCKVVFSKKFRVSISILGRRDFFKNFVVIFNEKKKIVKLRKL